MSDLRAELGELAELAELAEHDESERTGIPRPRVQVLDRFTRAVEREWRNPRLNKQKVHDITSVLMIRTYPHWFTKEAFDELRNKGLRVAPREKVR